jgi:hypothetical protein
MRRLNLRAIEARGWKAMHENGLFDLFFGVVLSANALSMLLDELGVAAAIRIGATLVLYAAGIVGSWRLRRRYVVPRTGTARFGASRQRRIHWTRLVLAASVLLTLTLLALITIARFPPSHWFGALGDFAPSALIGIIILIPLAVISYAFDSPRMAIHGMLFVGAEFATVVLERSLSVPAPGAIAFGSAAVVSLTIGLIVFARFLRTVPHVRRLPSEVMTNDR